MIVNPKHLTDGFTTLLGGVDESRQPLLVRTDQVSRAINLTFRGGFPKTRPPWMKRNLRFARGEYGLWFISHIFQGSEYYDDFRAMERIVVSVGGRLFLVDVTQGYLVTDITPRRATVTAAPFTSDTSAQVMITVDDATLIFEGYPIYIGGKEYTVDVKSGNTLTLTNREEVDGTVVASGTIVEYLDANSPVLPQAWFVQAEQYLVVQDGQSRPIIYDGASSRRTKLVGEIPTGTAMGYGNGRIWIAMNNGREFVAGDIAGGPTGVLGFEENTYLAGGGSFRVPANVGKIRSMRFVANLDTSLGQGPLQVGCDWGIFSVNAPVSREAWSSVTNPIQTVSLMNFGPMSQSSTVLINGDLFFRAEDGLRSFIIARRDFGNWGNTPISREMSRLLDRDTPELLQFSSAVMFDNRLLFTVTPQPGPNGVRHKGVIVLDFDLISTMGNKAPPAYDGLWTGVEVTGLVAGRFAGRPRCFAFGHDSEGQNDFWELTKVGQADNGLDPIDWVLETRSMSFPGATGGNTGLKRLAAGEAWLSEFAGTVTLTLQYRPDQYPCWQDWNTRTVCVTSDQCDDADGCAATTAGNLKGYKTRLGFGMPAEQDNEPDESTMLAAYSFQVRIEGSGYCQMNRFILQAHEEEELPMAPPGDERSECRAIACCPPDPFAHRALCGPPQPPVLAQEEGGFRLAFRFDNGATYALYGRTAEDGEQMLAQFEAEDVDGWFTDYLVEDFSDFPALAAGDTMQFRMTETSCGVTRSTELVSVIFTG